MKKISLLIEYDEAMQEIRFCELSVDGKRSLAIKVPLSLYRERGADQAERVMGETVFTFIDRWANVKIGLRDYESEARERLASMRGAITTLAEQGNAEAQYHLAIELFTSGVRNRSLKQIDEADAWLRKAAANGAMDAVEYLGKHWERDKASALRSIAPDRGE